MIEWKIYKKYRIGDNFTTFYWVDFNESYWIDIMNVREIERKLWMTQFKE